MLSSTSRPVASVQLPFLKPRQPVRYLVQTNTVSMMGTWEQEYTNESVYQLTVLESSAAGCTVEVNRSGFRQTPTDGLGRLDADMASLLDRLLLRLGPNGALVAVQNKPDLLQRFQGLRPNLKLRYLNDPHITPDLIDNLDTILREEGHLERVLSHAPELNLLLPACYNRPLPAEPGLAWEGQSQCSNVLGSLSIPLRTRTLRLADLPADVAVALQTEGEFDELRFEFDNARTILQTLTGKIDIDPTPDVEYLESFEFDHQGQLLYAGRFVVYSVPGVFQGKIVTTVAPDLPVSAAS